MADENKWIAIEKVLKTAGGTLTVRQIHNETWSWNAKGPGVYINGSGTEAQCETDGLRAMALFGRLAELHVDGVGFTLPPEGQVNMSHHMVCLLCERTGSSCNHEVQEVRRTMALLLRVPRASALEEV